MALASQSRPSTTSTIRKRTDVSYTHGEFGEFYVALSITGKEVDPHKITDVLGIEPSEGWRAGESTPRGVIASFGCWALESNCSHSYDIGQHVEWLVEHVPESLDEVREVAPGAVVEIEIALRAYNDRRGPVLNFTPELIARLATWGAAIDVDVYCIEPKGDEHLRRDGRL